MRLPDLNNFNFCLRWTAAYKVYTNQAKGDLGELRQTLQRGIEVVRVLGNHGLDIRLIVNLARTFERRVSIVLSVFLTPTKTFSGFYFQNRSSLNILISNMLNSLFYLSLNKCLNAMFFITHWLTTIHGVHLSLRFAEAEKPELLIDDMHVITQVHNHGKYLIKGGKEVITQPWCGIKL